jgi:hypothetical protein
MKDALALIGLQYEHVEFWCDNSRNLQDGSDEEKKLDKTLLAQTSNALALQNQLMNVKNGRKRRCRCPINAASPSDIKKSVSVWME